ncbi:hypothetical protein AGABI2DRAFT_180530, partial [Agaricus bisporus var. bisporus H97]|uniref:hypothetical protein n=1 Tax=Agaricus bisporus var. bisporus (strain H97 / ATCC MYA-4626 / FGSC 10389) TaxID=936046 RepID=UPI00029F6BAC
MSVSAVTFPRPLLLNTQLELVCPTAVAGTFYGIAFTLFCLYVHSLAPLLRDKDRRGRARFMLVYSTVIILCGLYVLVSNAWIIQDAYIKHRDYPGGPYIYIVSTYHAQPAIIACLTFDLAIDVLTSAIQIWRVWVIWNATKYAKLIIVFPSLAFLTTMSMGVRTLILDATLPLEEVAQLDASTHLAENAMQGAVTIFCTLSISLFLIFRLWRQEKLFGEIPGSGAYMKIVAILIESYALESIWILIAGILFHPVQLFFAETKPYVEIIAYLLVQYRVASGKAYESQRGQCTISSLCWNRSRPVTTPCGE